MENASKALMMAGGVLIGMMLLSLIVFTFQYTADFAKSYEDINEQNRLAAFNNQFEVYNRKGVKMQEIITIVNLAKDLNSKNGVENNEADPLYIKIVCESKSLEKYNSDDLYLYMENNTFVPAEIAGKDENGNTKMILQLYRCKQVQYSESGKVATMIFVKE